jgi:hypothetical protein
VLFAVVIPVEMTPGMTLPVVLDGAHWPVPIVILPLQLSQPIDEIDAVHCRLLNRLALAADPEGDRAPRPLNLVGTAYLLAVQVRRSQNVDGK